MTGSYDGSPSWLEHDHNHLAILLEDLEAISQVALGATDDFHILEDARRAVGHLLEELVHHLELEEQELFPMFLAIERSLAGIIDVLRFEHREMRIRIESLCRSLAESGERLLERRSDVITDLKEFRSIFERHSGAEWEILKGLGDVTTFPWQRGGGPHLAGHGCGLQRGG